jgi:hypothetical protein
MKRKATAADFLRAHGLDNEAESPRGRISVGAKEALDAAREHGGSVRLGWEASRF